MQVDINKHAQNKEAYNTFLFFAQILKLEIFREPRKTTYKENTVRDEANLIASTAIQ